MRRFGVEERRGRLALRHHLAPSARADSPVEIARDLVGLHGTDPASVYLAAWARMRTAGIRVLERALYDERELLRVLGMRGTMFVVSRDLAPVVQAACTKDSALRERRRLVQLLAQAGIATDPTHWLTEVEESTLRALKARGEATAAELADDEPRLREQLLFAQGKAYEGRQSVPTRVLFLLAAEGRIIRGRPRGSWTSTQYRWSLVDSWLSEGMAEWPVEAARVELARRWLAAYGPGTVDDLRWWTGWTVGQAKSALSQLRPVEVDVDGAVGLVLPDDLVPVPPPQPWAALLPALDPTVMGWVRRDFHLRPHAPALFDRSGNAGPTVWWDGRVVGGWAQRQGREIAVRLLEDVGADAAALITTTAERLRATLGTARVTPRFRTPLERELIARPFGGS